MKAIYIVKYGNADKAFEIREVPKPVPKAGQVLVKVEGFGLNFADVHARKGIYRDAPPLPCVIGYDVCGHVEEIANGAKGFKAGDRVIAFTHFGGYAEYVAADVRTVVKISDKPNVAEATALLTQYCTAYYCAAVAVNLNEGDKVLIHSAAGGVGVALMQYATHKRCKIFATTSSEWKKEFLMQAGALNTVNTSTEDFVEYIKYATSGEGVDVIFDSVGGSFVRRGMKALAPGGRMVCYGVATLNSTSNIFSRVAKLMQFGFYHPGILMLQGKGIIGVSMLKIALEKPDAFQRCLKEVIHLHEQKIFQPVAFNIFKAGQIASAHKFLEERKSIGKVACVW